MACPLFLPRSSRGDYYEGECAAQRDAQISVDTLRRCCNAGYARAVCKHAGQSNADAFRFLIRSHEAGVVAVAWSSESNHHPVAVGTILVNGAPAGDDPLERQAHACAETWFRRDCI
jgi:hypothetical protein